MTQVFMSGNVTHTAFSENDVSISVETNLVNINELTDLRAIIIDQRDEGEAEIKLKMQNVTSNEINVLITLLQEANALVKQAEEAML